MLLQGFPTVILILSCARYYHVGVGKKYNVCHYNLCWLHYWEFSFAYIYICLTGAFLFCETATGLHGYLRLQWQRYVTTFPFFIFCQQQNFNIFSCLRMYDLCFIMHVLRVLYLLLNCPNTNNQQTDEM